MSDTTETVASSLITGEVAREGAKMLAPFHRETKLALGMLALVIVAGWYVADVAIPKALEIINAGHKARDEAHAKNLEQVTSANTKDLEKVIAAFEKNADQNQKHNREILDVLKERSVPIAVNPLTGK